MIKVALGIFLLVISLSDCSLDEKPKRYCFANCKHSNY